MKRKLFTTAATVFTLFAATSAFIACGGDDVKPGPVTPTTATATTTTSSATDMASSTASAEPTKSAEPPPKVKTLYEKLGSKDGVMKVIDDFLAMVKDDKRINAKFAKTIKDPKKVEALKNNVHDQICEAGGGGCTYKGKKMDDAHKGMKITEVEFNAFVEDLGKALDKNGVAADAKDDLLKALGGMHDQIVNDGKPMPAPKASASAKPMASGSAKGK